MRAINVATFDRIEPAESLKQRLEQAGIHAIVHDETRLQRFGFLTKPAATKRVEVDQADFDRARQQLSEWDKIDGVLREAIRCPQCNSPRVEFPQYTRKFITPWLVEIFISLGLFPKEYYCEDCQYTWPKDPEPKPELDELGWPVADKARRSK